MSKRLTINEIQNKIHNIESKYYKGWNQNEWWWLYSGKPHPVDSGLWSRYHKLLNQRLNEIKYLTNIENILSIIDPSIYHHDEYVLEKYWFNLDQNNYVENLYDYCGKVLAIRNKTKLFDDFTEYRKTANPEDICNYIKTKILTKE